MCIRRRKVGYHISQAARSPRRRRMHKQAPAQPMSTIIQWPVAHRSWFETSTVSILRIYLRGRGFHPVQSVCSLLISSFVFPFSTYQLQMPGASVLIFIYSVNFSNFMLRHLCSIIVGCQQQSASTLVVHSFEQLPIQQEITRFY